LASTLLVAAALASGTYAQAPEHVYLTWRGSTATTITVNAQTDSTVQLATVYYDTEPRGGDVEAYRYRADASAHRIDGLADGRWIHWADLDGLDPGRPYYFVVGSPERGVSEERAFRTVPADATPVRFVAGGDLGVSDEMRALLRHAAAREPQFAVIGGDIAYVDGDLDYVATWDAWLDAWGREMVTPEGFTVPMVLAVGNHEVRGGYDGGPERAPFYMRFFAQPGTPSYFRQTFGDHTVLYALDTGHIVHHREQVGWLERHFAADQSIPNRFATYHIPLYPSHRAYDGDYSQRGRTHWAPLFDRYGLTTAFENHDHTFKRSKRLRAGATADGGTLYLGDGAWGRGGRTIDLTTRWYLDKAGATRHVWVVDAGPEAVTYRAFDAAGRVFDVYPRDTPGADEADAYFQTLPQLYELPGHAFDVTPLAATPGPFERDSVFAVVRNTEAFPAVATVWFEVDDALATDAGATTLALAPGDSAALAFDLRAEAPIPGTRFPEAAVHAAFDFVPGDPLRPDTVRVHVVEYVGSERAFGAPVARAPIALDGALGEWGALPFALTEPARHDEPPARWRDAADASLRFGLVHSPDSVFVAISVTDDQVLLAPEDGGRAQNRRHDGVLAWLDPHPGGEGDDDPYFMLGPGGAPGAARVTVLDADHEAIAASVRAAAVRTEAGYDLEFAVPKSALAPEGALGAVRLNLAIADVDVPGDDPDFVFWRPEWESAFEVAGFGVVTLLESPQSP
jgi:hypothetical protein